jgi:hypothetical protein
MTTSMSILNAIPQLDMTLHANLIWEDARPLGQP